MHPLDRSFPSHRSVRDMDRSKQPIQSSYICDYIKDRRKEGCIGKLFKRGHSLTSTLACFWPGPSSLWMWYGTDEPQSWRSPARRPEQSTQTPAPWRSPGQTSGWSQHPRKHNRFKMWLRWTEIEGPKSKKVKTAVFRCKKFCYGVPKTKTKWRLHLWWLTFVWLLFTFVSWGIPVAREPCMHTIDKIIQIHKIQNNQFLSRGPHS